ncbi:C2H2 finger domain protein [Aspergillus sclerotioniger CBS 115572]|uniref:C2H2 finger domain protein n=1 Tax=Aspergillus sclerotioniger CBS 115572 TaxID=1450535 RepID=A0A317VG23_9EURO|nr:C2H2 finger domain protein [Aspergillus sclerotioniger CBS 115572]PWY72121.1 C2H2 finger domain protein [Aspergillus sclerotioniger CBS 115572]
MAHFPTFADFPHMSSEDHLPQDYELFPSQYEPYTDPTMIQRPSDFQLHLSPADLSMKSAYIAPSMSWSAEPILSHTTGSLTAPSGFNSPWSSDLISTPGPDSPTSGSFSNANMGCYMSPPYTCDDAVLPQSGFSSPASLTDVDSLVVPSQLYPDPDPMVKLETESDNAMSRAFGYNSPPQHDEFDTTCDVRSCQYPDTTSQQDTCCPPSSQSKPQQLSKPNIGRIVKRPRKPSTKARTTSAARANTKTGSKKDGAVAGRGFICSFSHYGCQSTFVSKNEWKRHVTSQHIQPGFYRCDVGRCSLDNLSKNKSLNSSSYVSYNETHLVNDFNRKDLFTQHQRRMHAPWIGRNCKYAENDKEKDEFEQSLEAVRARCWHEQRKPPSESRCGFCGQHFTGARSWNDRMEHVGRHYEKGDAQYEAEDTLLRQWAVEEDLIRQVDGEWKLTALCEK